MTTPTLAELTIARLEEKRTEIPEDAYNALRTLLVRINRLYKNTNEYRDIARLLARGAAHELNVRLAGDHPEYDAYYDADDDELAEWGIEGARA